MVLKGQDVILKLNGEGIAKSTNCTLNITANTSDESSKDDANPVFDSPTVTNVTWNCTNESFVANVSSLASLLIMAKMRESIPVEVYDKMGVTTGSGVAYITNLSVIANNGENVTLSLSLQGSGEFN